VELAAALYQRVRIGTLTRRQARRAWRTFRRHRATYYHRADFNSTILNRATRLVALYPLRAYDAVQLAAALYLHNKITAAGVAAPIFLSADRQLLHAAAGEGLPADDPNLHP
jgi:predicted nucleic acid-binding protein